MTIKLKDLRGFGINHRQAEWNIGPVGHHRDSDPVEETNWLVTLEKMLIIDSKGEHHEVFRFGHWAVGWIEELAVEPGSECDKLREELAKRLETYPILDEQYLEEYLSATDTDN